jgi:hypothetical protein
MSKESVMAKLRSDVEAFGWHCLSVHPRAGDDGAHFTYTIGLTETFEHPEIMIFGLGSKVSHQILTDCVELIREGKGFLPDLEYQGVIGGGYKVVFKTMKPRFLSEYFGTAERYYNGRPFVGLVMFWPDKEHRFPWQEKNTAGQREALSAVQL